VPSATPVSSEIPVSEPSSVKQSVSKRKSEPAISWMEDLKEEEEEKPAVPRSVKKTPRRSEESGFSDYNPFQSGSEDAAGRQRRRRKVCQSELFPISVLTAVVHRFVRQEACAATFLRTRSDASSRRPRHNVNKPQPATPRPEPGESQDCAQGGPRSCETGA